MEPDDIYALLQRACHALEARRDHAIAAYVDHCMNLIDARYGVARDRRDQD